MLVEHVCRKSKSLHMLIMFNNRIDYRIFSCSIVVHVQVQNTNNGRAHYLRWSNEEKKTDFHSFYGQIMQISQNLLEIDLYIGRQAQRDEQMKTKIMR